MTAEFVLVLIAFFVLVLLGVAFLLAHAIEQTARQEGDE